MLVSGKILLRFLVNGSFHNLLYLFAGYKIITYLCDVINKQIVMPTVLILFGLKFRIYTAEHLPPHCHVTSQDGQAKFEILDSVRLVENHGLKPKDLRLAESILEENLELIQEEWKKLHGEF